MSASRLRPGSAHVVLGERARRVLPGLVAAEALIMVVLSFLLWHATRADAVDGAVERALYAPPGQAARGIAAAVSLVGSPTAAAVLAVGLAAVAWSRTREASLCLFAPLAVGAAALVEKALKALVARTRPSTAILSHLHDRSFPSGHATDSTALATAAVVLVWAIGPRRLRRPLTAAAVAYAVAVAASRLVLGVHYLTDVIGGVVVGTGVVLAAACWWTAGEGS